MIVVHSHHEGEPCDPQCYVKEHWLARLFAGRGRNR